MTKKPDNLKEKSDIELHEWITEHKPGSDLHIAAIQELMRRNESPVRKREMIAIGIAIISIAVAILVIVTSHQ